MAWQNEINVTMTTWQAYLRTCFIIILLQVFKERHAQAPNMALLNTWLQHGFFRVEIYAFLEHR